MKLSRQSVSAMVREAAQFMELEDVARRVNLSVEEVRAMLGAKKVQRSPCVVIDAKSRKVSHHVSFRAAYRHVCIAGLTDWSWHTKADYDAWCEVNGVKA